MRVLAVIVVKSAEDAALALRPVGGRPWIARLVDRLATATSVSKVVVSSLTHTDEIAACLAPNTAVVADDPIEAARRVEGDHTGVTLCPLTQLFADPARLNTLASLTCPADAARLTPVLACDTTISLAGGAFLEILTRRGLAAVNEGVPLSTLPVAHWPTWPEPPQLRVETHRHVDWAVAAYEALLRRETDGNPVDPEHLAPVLDDPGLQPFVWWDGMGPQPRSILTIRCVRRPLFERLLSYARRLGSPPVDVVCHGSLADDTVALQGVGRIIPFETPHFDLEALPAATLASIRGRRYDLCVIPVRDPSRHGFDNVIPLAKASAAHLGIWLDVFGRRGILSGAPPISEPTSSIPAPFDDADLYVRRARTAFAELATRRPGALTTLATPGGFPSDTSPRLGDVLRRLDENLSSRRLVDNRDLGIVLSGELLHELPATAEIDRCLTALEAEGLTWVTELTAIVDALFEQLIIADSGGLSPRHAVSTHGRARDTLRRLSASVSRLTTRVTQPDAATVGPLPGART